ncbi:MAG TPA: phosphoribosyltransferase [Verrucomicrobiae bacterium]|jgi:predicted phosphoribosyltransferase
MSRQFHDRIEAGQLLALELARYAHRPDVLVLGLPRGGVVVASEVARQLGAPLDIFLVRKLGTPHNEELALGAIASGGVRVLNGELVERLGISDEMIDAIAGREQLELERRERAYRGHRPPVDVEGKIVLLIDDGIATGATMHAVVDALRQQGPAKIVVAVPTAAASSLEEFRAEADEVVAVIAPTDFYGVGQWYENFTQTTDEEVCELLDRAQRTEVGRPTG